MGDKSPESVWLSVRPSIRQSTFDLLRSKVRVKVKGQGQGQKSGQGQIYGAQRSIIGGSALQSAEKSRKESLSVKVFVCVSNICADTVDRLSIGLGTRVFFQMPRVMFQAYM